MAGRTMPFATTRRMRWGCSLAGVLFAGWLNLPPAVGRDPEREDLDQWHQNLVRDRHVEVRLRSAQKNLDAGRLVEGLTELQSILDRDEDVFVRLESESVPRGAHTLAASLVGVLPPQSLAAYEALFGSQARQLLESSPGSPNPALLAQVVHRFQHTAAGFEAGQRLAAWWIDHGSDALAWGWFRHVLAEPAQRARVTPALRAQAACCAMRLDQADAAREILESIERDITVKIAGRSISISRWLKELNSDASSQTIENSSGGNGSGANGRRDRDILSQGSPPALGHAIWRETLAGEQSRHVATLALAWETYQLQNGLPIGTSQLPLLVGEKLVFRDFEGLRAVDVRSGKTLWFHPCVSALCREISPRQTIPADGNPDPNNVMRMVVGNFALQTLSSDARHVFAVDRIEPEETAPVAATAGSDVTAPRPPCNVLAAFELAAEGLLVNAKWTVGGREEGRGEKMGLAGHCFLSPPLCVADRLFAVSERRQQLHLSCLKADTGDLIWTQVICSVSQSIEADYQRFGMACSPTYAEGVVVCPTQAGVLVAVDSLSGTLLWAASHDDDEPQLRQQMSSWPYSSRRKYAHHGYVNLPVVHRSHVVYLPAHSEYVHCLDLEKGCVRWRTRREDAETSATEYVAAVTDATVVLVGRRKCRGLEIDSGSERWEVRLGCSPSGQGVRLGNGYHVPLEDGRIVSLDLDSGRQTSTPGAGTKTAARRPLGNLLAGRDLAGCDLIVSMRPGEISVFPQTHVVLDGLYAKLKVAPHDSQTLLDVAELEMTLERVDQAERRLEDVAERSCGTWPAVRAEELLRELLVQKIRGRGERADADLERLAALSAAPEDLGKYLLERCLSKQARDHTQPILAAARELAHHTPLAALEAPGDPSRSAAGHVLAAELLRRPDLKNPGRNEKGIPFVVQAQFVAETEFVGERGFAKSVSETIKSGDTAALQRLVDLHPDDPQADGARLQLAQLFAAQGRFQQAETILLACRQSSLPQWAGQSTRMLAELWSGQGLHCDAARLFAELATQYADVEVAPQQSGAAWLTAFPRDHLTFKAYRHRATPHWSGTGARITEERLSNEALQTVYNGNGTQYLPTPRQSAFDLFDRGRGANGLFAVVNRHTGQEYPETIRVPGRVFYPAAAQPSHVQHAYVGNFFPAGGTGALHGISLLERKLLWTTVPKALANVKDVVRVGPAGPRFCTFQHRQHLFVVDPLDGHVLWQRDDLEATSGLMHESFLGIIGDDRVLVVFASNNANYTVYDTACGAELRRGKLDIQHRLTRRAIGRHLFHCTSAANSRRLRIWDPASDSYTLDEPAGQIAEVSVLEGVPPGTKIMTFVRDTDEVAFVTNSGRIRVVNLINGRERLDVAVDPELVDNLSRLGAFRDHDRYFFNLQCSACKPAAVEKQISGDALAISDALVPCQHVEGELCAVDAATQRLLWRRTLGKRSILQLPDLTLPVLVNICRIRKQPDQSCLAVELIDVQSGETLAAREDLLSDRLLQAAYDRPSGMIELRGAKTVIRLEFPESIARLNAGDPLR